MGNMDPWLIPNLIVWTVVFVTTLGLLRALGQDLTNLYQQRSKKKQLRSSTKIKN